MRRLVLGVLTASFLLVSGCSGSDSSGAEGTPTSSTTSPDAATSASPASPGATTAPTAGTSSAGAAAATGPVITGPISSVHAPDDWVNQPTSTGNGGTVSGPTVAYMVNLNDLETAVPDESTDFLADLQEQTTVYSPPLKRRDDVVVAGQPAFTFAGNDNTFGGWAEEYGFRYQGHSIVITIATPRDTPQSERDALSASVLASVTFTS